jgi:uncharacterized delta-60 repeat protein
MKQISTLITTLLLFISFNLFAQLGSLDASFGVAGKFNSTYITGSYEISNCIVTLPDGKMLIGGQTKLINAITDSTQYILAKVSENGTRDYSFGIGGFVTDYFGTYGSITKIKVQNDGKILAILNTNSDILDSAKITLLRFNSDGSYDNSFGTNGKSVIDFGSSGYDYFSAFAEDLTIQSDGKILVCGTIDSLVPWLFTMYAYEDMLLIRLNNNGTIDSTFGYHGRVKTDFESKADIASQIEIQPDGKIVVAGSYTVNSGSERNFGFVRYHPDGTLDTGFGMNGKSMFGPVTQSWKTINDLKLQEDGKLVAAGYVLSYLDVQSSIVLRMNSNGTPDASFGTAGFQIITLGGISNTANSLLIQPNGMILLGGYKLNGYTSSTAITMYLWPTGFLNGSWGSGGIQQTNFNSNTSAISALGFQPSGKLVVAGYEANMSGSNMLIGRFQTDLLPIPTQISPVNNSSMNSNLVTVKWNLHPTATHYELEYATNSSFVNSSYAVVYADSSNLNLLPSTTYYWKIKAWEGSKASLWSSIWNFTTGASGNLVGDVFTNPIHILLPHNQTYSNTITSGFTSSYTGQYNQTSPDIFYHFTTSPCADSILLNTCGSSFDTYLHLLQLDGTHIQSNDDNGPLCIGTSASLKIHVQPNTSYILVAEGYGSNTGNIQLNVSEIAPPCPGILHLKLFIQGLYVGNGAMQSALTNTGLSTDVNIADTVTVELHDYNNPQILVASQQTILRTDGTITTVFPTISGIYFVAIKHRNTVETWSAYPVLLGSYPGFHDFTNLALKAFGSNQVEVGNGVWALYSGDVNQDGAIDAFDYLQLDPDVINGAYGYLTTDLTGDGFVDAFDYILLDENLINGVSAFTP